MPLAFAHRGGAAEAPENSWAAFEHAVALGYRYVETDVRATSDGVAVAFHDPDLSRLTGRKGLVRKVAWRELQHLELAAGQRVPKLEDLLGAWGTLMWNIDVKRPEAVGPVAEAVRRTRTTERVLLTAFSDWRLAALKRALGTAVATGAGRLSVAALLAASRLKLAPPAIKAQAVQVPPSFRGLRVVDEHFVRTCHRAGAQVHVWTVNDEAEMAQLLDLGVDGLMTDRPSVLKRVLLERGQWFSGNGK